MLSFQDKIEKRCLSCHKGSGKYKYCYSCHSTYVKEQEQKAASLPFLCCERCKSHFFIPSAKGSVCVECASKAEEDCLFCHSSKPEKGNYCFGCLQAQKDNYANELSEDDLEAGPFVEVKRELSFSQAVIEYYPSFKPVVGTKIPLSGKDLSKNKRALWFYGHGKGYKVVSLFAFRAKRI